MTVNDDPPAQEVHAVPCEAARLPLPQSKCGRDYDECPVAVRHLVCERLNPPWVRMSLISRARFPTICVKTFRSRCPGRYGQADGAVR